MIDRELLETCEREPIHLCGAIQPHGWLCVTDTGGQITHVGGDSEAWFGLPSGALLGRSVFDLIPEDQVPELAHVTPQQIRLKHGQERECYVWSHGRGGDGGMILELEGDFESDRVRDTSSALDALYLALNQTMETTKLCESIATTVQHVTGFDRVMVYRFDEHWNGQVIAEACLGHVSSRFLGLNFPAADIPPQARALYATKLIRTLADTHAPPWPIEPPCGPDAAAPVDLSPTYLRSVSPVHLEYLENMGVRATMSVSILVKGKLWGLVACHHYEPKLLHPRTRMMCETIGRIASLQLGAAAEIHHHLMLANARQKLQHFTTSVLNHDSMVKALQLYLEEILPDMDACGVMLSIQQDLWHIGQTPSDQWGRALHTMITQNPLSRTTLFETSTLRPEDLGLAPEDSAALGHLPGLLVVLLSPDQTQYVAFLRPSKEQVVQWAGNPEEKQVATGSDGSRRLRPRGSFALWQQTVKGQSVPWQPWQKNFLLEMRDVFLHGLFRRMAKLSALGLELEQHNQSLESFSYIVSHDLKTPLRGIINYATFLKEDYAQALDREGVSMIDAMIRLSLHTDALLGSILEFSTSSSRDLPLEAVDVLEIVDELRLVYDAAQPQHEKPLVWHIAQEWPLVKTNKVALRQVVDNLISNAIKYNDKEEIQISVYPDQTSGHPNDSVILCVWDNGPGIAKAYQDLVFQIFKRPGQRRQGVSGSGVGLALAKKLIERMHGKIWNESVEGVSSTFFVSLPQWSDFG